MRLSRAAVCSFALATASISAQDPSTAALKAGAEKPAPNTVIYDAAADVVPPALLPPKSLEVSTEKCKRKNRQSNDLRFSLFITSDGEPRRIMFLRAAGNNLDQTALDLIDADRFTPARQNGESVAVWQSIEVTFQSCKENPKDKTDFPTYILISQPQQKLAALENPPKATQIPIGPSGGNWTQPYRVGGNIWPPVPLHTPEARYSNEARARKIQGECLVSLVVDAHGMPQNPRVVRPIGYGLDERAIEAVRNYRFKPALRGGFEPVPVMMSVQINFRLY